MFVKKTHAHSIHLKEALPNIVSFSQDPPNVFSITHKTRYRYTHPISSSSHILRLQPEQSPSQQVLKYESTISVNPAEVCNFIEPSGNNISFIEIKETYHSLDIISKSIVSVSQEPVRGDLKKNERIEPMEWSSKNKIIMKPYLILPKMSKLHKTVLSEYAMSFIRKNKHDLFDVLQDINKTIYKEYSYTSGLTDPKTTPYEVYLNKCGVCQDFTNLFICLARLLGIAARYRVGYIYTGRDYKHKKNLDASHAWVEAYLPYLGWVGFDPTNGCLAGKNHIKVACGCDFEDATPTSGTVFAKTGKVEEILTTSVQVTLLF